METSNITDKVVVITGASSGIGKAREASRRTRSKSCTRSAAFEPDRRSGSRDLGQRARPSICHRCDEARRIGTLIQGAVDGFGASMCSSITPVLCPSHDRGP